MSTRGGRGQPPLPSGGPNLSATDPFQPPAPPSSGGLGPPPPPPNLSATDSPAPLCPTQAPAAVALNTTPVPPIRPGLGTLGNKVEVKANHFLVEVQGQAFFRYEVSILPKMAHLSKKERPKERRDVMNRIDTGGRLLVYDDDSKSCYAAEKLPSNDFEVSLPNSDGGIRNERVYKVTIQFSSKAAPLHLQQFMHGRQNVAPHETIQFLDAVLMQTPNNKCTVVGQSFFSRELGGFGELGNGLEYSKGFYQSLSHAQMGFSLNIGLSTMAFYEPIYVSEYVQKHFNIDLSRPLSKEDRLKVERDLHGVRIETNHQGHITRYTIVGVSTEITEELMFPLDESGATTKSVLQYFKQHYDIALKYPKLPALQARSSSKRIFFPMEVCKIVEGQRYSKKLNVNQVNSLLRITCQRPSEQDTTITNMVGHKKFYGNEILNEFGIKVNPQLTSIEARVLPTPTLKYHDSGRQKTVVPNVGQWDMTHKKMIDGGKVEYWGFINFSSLHSDAVNRFIEKLISVCNDKGMTFNKLQPLVGNHKGRCDQIEVSLKSIHTEACTNLAKEKVTGKHLQLLIIILPDACGSYETIKRVCETDLGIVSQCCQPKKALKCHHKFLEYMSLKINVKVGGRNSVLEQALSGKIDAINQPTIIFGANVTHPQGGDDSSPSIAAVVASMDWPEVAKYRGLASAQFHREEIIQDLQGMIGDHLVAFHRATGFWPIKIIFYRDGVNETQLSQVLLHEMDAIRKACSSVQKDYMPKVTFVVVKKRHHTRLFPANHRDPQTRSGNIMPGTVVDTKICHPHEFDFYLCSHAGFQGTSRPAHYRVLYDENNFTPDNLQLLTYFLCYTYARSTESVSIVPPIYYARLTVFHARCSEVGGGVATQDTRAEVRSLLPIKENVKDVMFFC